MPRPRTILGYVFGYGTLADPDDWLYRRNPGGYPDPVYAFVDGYRRHWDVGAENSAPEHDHKYHADVGTGERPDIVVAALGIEEAAGARCNGLAIPVDAERLSWFDQREGRLYDRVELAAERVSEPVDGPLWTYLPKRSAIECFERGLREGRAFVPRYYLDRMASAFGGHGEAAVRDYRRSTRPPRCPVRDLELVRAPGDAGI